MTRSCTYLLPDGITIDLLGRKFSNPAPVSVDIHPDRLKMPAIVVGWEDGTATLELGGLGGLAGRGEYVVCVGRISYMPVAGSPQPETATLWVKGISADAELAGLILRYS